MRMGSETYHAVIGYDVVHDDWGRGMATETEGALVGFGFSQINSRSRGVGARYIRSRTAAASTRHRPSASSSSFRSSPAIGDPHFQCVAFQPTALGLWVPPWLYFRRALLSLL